MSKVICFDLRPLQIGHENRGIGMVIKSILDNLTDTENEYIFYTFEKNNPIESLGLEPKISYKIVTTPTVKTSIKHPFDVIDVTKLTFHKFHALRAFKPDVFIQFDFTLGLPRWRKTRTFIFAYDLIPLIMRSEYLPSPLFAFNRALGKKSKIKSTLRALYYQTRYKLQYSYYKRSNKIISISKSTTKSFEDILGIPKSKIATLPLAPVSAHIAVNDEHSDKIPKEPFIFYIGGTDSRKRVDEVIYAFNLIRSRGHKMKLVLAGNEFLDRKTIPDNKTRDAVNSSPYRDDIILAGFVSDAQKNALYKSAHAFVFCSVYEGFGLPVIEAMAHSCPVVAYNNSSIPEAAGDAAQLVPTGDYVAMAKATIELFDTNLRSKSVAKGLIQAEKFSWDTYVRDFLKTITE